MISTFDIFYHERINLFYYKVYNVSSQLYLFVCHLFVYKIPIFMKIVYKQKKTFQQRSKGWLLSGSLYWKHLELLREKLQ